METGYLSLSGGRIFLRKWGEGEQLLICFHGFADSGARFESLAASLPSSFTLVAPDLPWHGQTEWNSEQLLPADLVELVHTTCSTHGFEKACLLGHSWGGRLLACSLPVLEPLTNKAWLVAPGGFVSGLYWGMENSPDFFRSRLISFAETNMQRFMQIMDFLGRIGLFNVAALRYLLASLEKANQNRQLFPVWKNLSNFKLSTGALRNLNIPVFFLLGERDSLLSRPKFMRFARQIPSAQFRLLGGIGHWPSGEVLAREILENF